MSNAWTSLGVKKNAKKVVSNRGSIQTKKQSSPGQQSYYYGLCKRKNVSPQNPVGIAFDTVSEWIQELEAYKPATVGQVEKINSLCKEIGRKLPSNEFISALTGGDTGTASKLIMQLLEQKKEMRDKLPLSDAQVETILPMFMSPTVNFHELGLVFGDNPDQPSRIYYGEQLNGVDLWRLPTPSEVEDKLRDNVTIEQASRFISANSNAYYDWKNNQILPHQIKEVRRIEELLSNTYKPQVVETAFDFSGEEIVMETGMVSNSSKGDKGASYDPISDFNLQMFTREGADEYIQKLRYDLNARELYSGFESEANYELDQMTKEMDQMETSYEILNKERQKNDENVKQYMALVNSLHQIQKMTNHYDDEVVDKAFYMFDKDGNEVESLDSIKERKAYIRAYFFFVIEQEYATVQSLVSLMENNDAQLGIDILLNK